MTTEQADFANWLQDLAARFWTDQRIAAERYAELLQRLARGEMDANQLRDDTVRFASQESARYAHEVAELSLGYYSALLNLGRAYSDRFFEQVADERSHAAETGNGHSTRQEPRQAHLDLRGQTGQEATAGFVIENKRDAPANISFKLSDFTDTAGGRPFPAWLQLDPPRLTLGPEQEAEVRLRLPLPPELFIPGHQYRTQVTVQGYDDLELVITVTVDAAAEPATRVATVATAPDLPPAIAKKVAGKRPRRPAQEAARSRKPRRAKDNEPQDNA